jgi:hypothetical protein
MGVKGIKGFNKGLICNKFNCSKQYAENTEYEENVKPECCQQGMHFVENPLDVFAYYPIGDSEYAKVEAMGDIARHNDDSKIATNKLKIGLKVDLKGIIEAGVDFIFKKTKSSPDTTATTGECANAATTGNGANAATTGEYANAATTGEYANAATTGEYANAATTGNGANAATTGYRANAATTGEYANAATTGEYANAATTGEYANAATTGNGANAATTGKNTIAAAIGIYSRAKSALGNWIVVAEWRVISNQYTPVCVKAAKVDGTAIKADTYYKLENGEFMEADK